MIRHGFQFVGQPMRSTASWLDTTQYYLARYEYRHTYSTIGGATIAAGKKILLLFLFLDKPKNSPKTVGLGLGPSAKVSLSCRVQLLRMGTDRPGRWLCVTGLNRAIDGPKSVWSFVHQRSFAVVVSVGSERGRPRSLRRPDGGQRSFRCGSSHRAPIAARKAMQVTIVTSSRVHQTRGLQLMRANGRGSDTRIP